ncbi:Cof-type HAD-IIB family hydrolase [Lysinibacillus fusiformis]|uniref:Cof-type HAD-IIB family hydrolase n=1 Tax=Lysinibacillus fusiformis TaxID=28031 RepID=UPI002EB5E24A|nr:Cof-type HAD-IIB family hydrolase [Lysinibacillus fusiformis]
MNYNIIFFDVDGTLINYEDGCVEESTKQAIQLLQERGIHLVAATGRPLSMCQEIQALGIETFITANGAYVKHKDLIIHKTPIAKDIVQNVQAFAREQQHSLTFFTEQLSMNGIQHPAAFNTMQATLSLRNFPVVNEKIVDEEVFLMCLYADEEAEKRYASQFPHIFWQRWHPYIVNVLQQDVAKSIAVKAVLDHFNIDPENAIAFGDGDNDIDMLEHVGLGIAMGNGSAALKAVANFVTKSSTEGGIDFALRQFQMI